MNFSCLYFYPHHNLGRKACSCHFEGFKLGKILFSGGCQIFALFLGRLCKLSDILRGELF